MSKYFVKGSIPFKIFACVVSVMLVVGCVFVPGSALAQNPGPTVPTPNVHDEDYTKMLLDPSSSALHPLDWYDESYAIDPYGNEKNDVFKLIEQNSVFNLTHANQEEMEEYAHVWQNYSAGETGKFASSFTNDYGDSNQVPNAIRWSDALQAVSFNLSADVPQNDHIAIIGFDYESGHRKVKLWIYNAKTKKWSDAQVVGNLSWSDVGGDSYYGDLEPFMSITAGDYDGDKIDTVVTYAGDCNSDKYGVTEWTITEDLLGKPLIAERSKDSNFKLLNQAYASKGVGDDKEDDGDMIDIYNATGHYAAGNGSLHAILKTGDFNGDNIDDLAVMSSLNFESSGQAKKYDWRLGAPYLSISKGVKDGTFLDKDPFFGDYVGVYNETAKTCSTMGIENFAVARLGKHSADSIVVGGRGWSYTGDANGKLSSATPNDTLSMARYDLKDDGSFGFNTYTSQCYEQNATAPTTNTKNGFGTECNYGGGNGHWAWNPICAQAVYMNGKGNDPYILMDGDLYHWKENGDAPQKIFKYKDKDGNGLSNYYPGDQNFFPLACTCAGVWDGNGQGYEQVVFGLCHRQGGSGGNKDDYNVTYITIGINPNVHDENTGLPSGIIQEPGKAYDSAYSDNLFFCTSKKDDRQVDDKGSISNNGLHFPLCNMDYSAEEGGVAGVVAKYTSYGLTYSDPTVEYIVQAPPYYSDSSDDCIGTTGFYEEFTVSKETTEMNQVTEEEGYSTGLDYSGIFLRLGTKKTQGSVQSYKKSFSNKVATERKLDKKAGELNVVVVRRYPFCFYNYETYDPQTKNWDANLTNSYLQWDQVFEAPFTVAGYNEFAKQYNERCAGIDSLDQLDMDKNEDLFFNQGNPWGYKKLNSLTPISKQFRCGNDTELTDETGISLSNSVSWEQQSGVHFHYDKKFGIGLGFMNWALDFSSENYGDTQEMFGKGTTNEKGLKIGRKYNVKAPYTYQHIIICQATQWTCELVKGKDENGKDINVPVYGYMAEVADDGGGDSGDQTYLNEITNTGGDDTVSDLEISEGTSGDTTSQGNLLSSFVGPVLAYAASSVETNPVLNFKWNTGENSADCSYQVYTSINGEIMKVGNPVKGNEFKLDLNNPSPEMKDVADKLKNQEWPIYQFAVSTISPSGQEGSRSGWVYFCSSKYFKEAVSCYVSRNDQKADTRLKIYTKLANQEGKTRLTDSIGLLRTNDHIYAKLLFGNAFKNNEGANLELKDDFKYKVEDFEYIKNDGHDKLYNVKFANKENPDDVKNFVIRMDDGKNSTERMIEAEILLNWKTVDDVKAAMDNEETREATAQKLSDISQDLHSSTGLKVTGYAKDVYYAGIQSYLQYYGQDYSGVIVALIIFGIGAIALIALALYFFFRDKKKNGSQAKSTVVECTKTTTPKSKYGSY